MDSSYPRRKSTPKNPQKQQAPHKEEPETDTAPRRKNNAIVREQPEVTARHKNGRGRYRGRRDLDEQVRIRLSGGTEITIRHGDKVAPGPDPLSGLPEAGCGERDEVVCSLLTLAAEHKVLVNKSVITLRLMLHACCSTQSNSQAERAKYYDPGMEEVKRLMLEPSPCPYSRIDIELVIEDGSQWTPKRKFPLRKVKEGRTFQHHADVHYHPEQLVDFPLEAKVDAAPLSCHLEINIHYTHPNHIQNYLINLDYPSSFTPSHRNSEVQADLLEKIFIAIARNIGPDFGQLAIRLGIKQHDRHEIERNHLTAFDRNFEMLSRWRMMCPELATVERLINVLSECGRKDLAETVHRKSSITAPPILTGGLTKPQDTRVSEEEKEEEDEEEEEEKGERQRQEDESPKVKVKQDTMPRTSCMRQQKINISEEEESQDEEELDEKGEIKIAAQEMGSWKENRESMSITSSRRHQRVRISEGHDTEDDEDRVEKLKEGKPEFWFKPRCNTK